jgi:hypothetical protein
MLPSVHSSHTKFWNAKIIAEFLSFSPLYSTSSLVYTRGLYNESRITQEIQTTPFVLYILNSSASSSLPPLT